MFYYFIHGYDHLSQVLAALLSRAGVGLRQWSGDGAEPQDLYQAKGLIVSSGLGTDQAARELARRLRLWAQRLPLLALGQAGIAYGLAFGLKPGRLPEPLLGESRRITVGGGASPVFQGIPRELQVGCYLHAYLAPGALPNDLVALARDAGNNPLALRHLRYPATALLFHPAAQSTEHGERMLVNWLGAL